MVGEGSGAEKIGRVKSKTQPRRVNGNNKTKGGPDNYKFRFKGVRQRSWGKWVAEIKEPGKGKRKWLGTFTTAQEAAHAYDREALALYGSQAQFNLQPSSSRPVSSHPTTLRSLLPRPQPLNPRPYPEPRPQHHFLLSGSPPSAALQFNDVPGCAMLMPATSMPHPQHHFLLSGSPTSAALQFSNVPGRAMQDYSCFNQQTIDQNLHPALPYLVQDLSGSPTSAALQFSDLPGSAMLMPATSMQDYLCFNHQTSDQNLHPALPHLVPDLSGSPTSAALQFGDLPGSAMLMPATFMQDYSFFNPQHHDTDAILVPDLCNTTTPTPSCMTPRYEIPPLPPFMWQRSQEDYGQANLDTDDFFMFGSV